MDLSKLRKVYALTDSPNENEAAMALAKVKAMLAAEGKTMRDLPAMLASPAVPNFEGYTYRDPEVAAMVRDILAQARAGVGARPFVAYHPTLTFLYANLAHLSEAEKTSLMRVSLKHTPQTIKPKQEAAINHLATLVRQRMAAKEAARG